MNNLTNINNNKDSMTAIPFPINERNNNMVSKQSLNELPQRPNTSNAQR